MRSANKGLKDKQSASLLSSPLTSILPFTFLLRYRQLPRLRLSQAVSPPLRKLLFLHKPFMEGEEQRGYSGSFITTHAWRYV